QQAACRGTTIAPRRDMTRTHASPGKPSAAAPAPHAADHADPPGLISESLAAARAELAKLLELERNELEEQNRTAHADLHGLFEKRRGELSQQTDGALATVKERDAANVAAVHKNIVLQKKYLVDVGADQLHTLGDLRSGHASILTKEADAGAQRLGDDGGALS